jgi:pantetheine-phosphate adenylyltransferase
MKDTIWIYPGSFDPPTYGHVNIIERASKLCGHLIVAVLENYEKTSLFSVDERVNMLQEVVKGLDNVEVTSFSGLQVDFYKHKNASAVVRGLRTSGDFDYEVFLAHGIRMMDPDYEVVFLATESRYSCISSSAVRALAAFGGDVSAFVPSYVEKKVREKFKEKYL